MANAPDRTQQLIDAVLKMRDEREAQCDESVRGNIARELGITEEELLEARKVGEDHLVRGQGFLRHSLLDDALKSFLAADALLPDDLRVLQALGNTYVLKGDKARGRMIAARLLSLDPKNEGAFHLLRLVETRSRAWVAIPVGFAVLGLVTGGVLAFFAQLTSNGPPPLVSTPPVIQSAPPPSSYADEFDSRCEDNSSMCSAMIPQLPPIPEVELWFEPTSSGLYRENDQLKLKLVGRIRPRGQSELEELTANLVCLDKEGREVDRIPVSLFPKFEPTLRPGDTHPFHISERTNAKTMGLTLEVKAHRKSPSPGEYERSTPIAVTVPPGLPGHLQFSLASRTRQVRGDDGTSVQGVLEVTNTGSGVIRGLEAKIQCLDAEGGVQDDSSMTMVYSHMVPMDPGERRAETYSCYGKGKIAKERVLITKLE